LNAKSASVGSCSRGRRRQHKGDRKMNGFRLDAMRRKYPSIAFLTQGVDAITVDSVCIEKVSDEVLYYTPQYSGATGSLVGIDSGARVHFALKDGTVMQDAVHNSGDCHHNEAYQDDQSWEGETILEAIYRHGIRDTLDHIVKERYGYKVENHYSVGGRAFTVYQAPEGISIQNCLGLRMERREAEAKIEAEIAALAT